MKPNQNSNYQEFVEDKNTCRNCNKHITGNFCANCGQKTSIHRYSFKYFLKNNLIYGFFNIDGGLFFTIKQLFTRPGHSVRAFINGKRVGYFNVITLLLITIAFSHFIAEFAQVKLTDLVPEGGADFASEMEKFSKKYPKIALLLTIPFYTIFSFLWFRKAKLNLSEHIVLNSYKTASELLIGLIFTILTIFYTDVKNLIIIYYTFIVFGVFTYSFWYYKQFFSVYGYSKAELIVRSLGAVFSPYILSVIVAVLLTAIKIIRHIGQVL